MTEMLHHTRAVARGVKRALVIGDMPFMSYQVSIEQAVLNAGRFLQEGRAQAVKLEGGTRVLPSSCHGRSRHSRSGAPGAYSQSAAQMGGFKVQGKSAHAARVLIEDAQALAEAVVSVSSWKPFRPRSQPSLLPLSRSPPSVSVPVRTAMARCWWSMMCSDCTTVFCPVSSNNTPSSARKCSKPSRASRRGGTRDLSGPEHSFTMKEEELEKVEKG